MSTSPASFYVAGGTLRRDAPSYVERRADADLYEGLTAGHYCYVLTSRQMGKSSLMVRTAVRLRADKVAVAVLDLTAIGQNVSAEQWYEGLLGLIGQQLNLEDELEDFWLENKRVGPLQRWMRAIREVVMTRRQERIVIFVDEIDAVRSLPFSTDEFFAGIREFYNRRTEDVEMERLTFCLLGVATPSDLIRDTRTTPFNIGQRIELTDFTEMEATPLIQGLGHNERLGRTLLQRVLYWTGGHPYLTQRLCQSVAENESVSNAGGVDRMCQELFLSARARERDDNLLFVRERLLRSEEADRASMLDLYLRVHKRKRVVDDETNPLISILRLSGITRVVEGYLLVRNRIYLRVFDSEWVRANMPDAELQRQRAAYRKGLLRATMVAAIILAVMSGLAYSAISQKRTAESERARAEDERNRADENAQKLRLALDEARMQRGIAEEQTRQAKEAKENAEEKSREAEEQKQIAENQKAEAVKQRSEAEALRAFAETGRRTAEAERNRAEAEARRNLQLSYDADMNLAQQAWERTYITRLFELLEKYRPATGEENTPKDLRGFEWYYQWQRVNGRLLTFKGHEEQVNCVAFSPDGKRLASASWDKTIKLWDAVTGQELLTLKSEGHFRSVAFSPDGKRLASASDDATVGLWDAVTGQVLLTLKGHEHNVMSVAFSPDGKRLASASWDKTIKLWDAVTGQELLTLKGHEGHVVSVVFSPDGKRLASADIRGLVSPGEENSQPASKKIKLWDAMTGQELLTIEEEASVESVAFSPDGKRLVATSHDNTFKLWDAATGKELLTLKGHEDSVMSVVFSPDGKRLASASADKTIKLWDAVTGQELLTLKGHEASVESVAFSPDGKQLASASGDSTVKLWDAVSGQEPLTLKGHENDVSSVVFSPDGKQLASASRDGTVKLWDAVTGQELLTLKSHEEYVDSVAFSPDGKRLASAGDKQLKLWDAVTGQELLTIKDELAFRSVVFSPDGKRLASIIWNRMWGASGPDDHKIRLWDAVTGQELLTIKGKAPFRSVVFSLDSRRLASASEDKTIKLWDVITGRELLTLKGEAEFHSVAFSPDGKQLASASWGLSRQDNTLKLWDAITGKELLTLKGHEGSITAVVFSPDSKRLASAGGDVNKQDNTIRLWDAMTGQELLVLTGHEGYIRSVVFSPDGSRLASAGDDKTIKLWDASTKDSLSVADLNGIQLFKQKNYAAAETAFRKAIKLTPNNDKWHYYLGMSLEGQGKLAEAEAEYKESTRLSPDNIDYLKLLADLLYKQGKYAEAETPYRKVTKIKPDDLDALHNLAFSLYTQKKFTEAEATYREVLRLNPNNPGVLNNLGYLLAEQNKNLDEALEMLQRAAKSRPNDSYILDSLGWVYFKLGNYTEALRYLTESARLLESAENLEHIGDTQRKLGNKAAAIEAWSKALALAADGEQKNRIQSKLGLQR